MNNRPDFTDDASRFGQWLIRPFAQVKEAVGELLDQWRTARAIRKKRRNEVRTRRRMRRSIMSGTLLGMGIFTVVYWGAAFLVMSVSDIYDLMKRIAVEFLLLLPGQQYLSDLPEILIPVYAAVMVIWPLVSLYRTAGYLDSVYTSADGILDRNSELPQLPPRISDLDMKLRSIRLAVAENEQLAREAEQRKNDLVVYLAHDLKTPLASVIGYLTLLEEAPDLPVELRAKYTAITLDKAYRLEQLINEFFDITRFSLQTIQPEHNRIDLCMMLRQIADEFYPVLEDQHLSVQLRLPHRLIMTGDSDQLMRVFDNLLRNAVSYSYEHTVITVAAKQSGGRVQVSVRNVGDRISPENLERLFEKFFRADSARRSGTGGSGLGLAIARNIVEQHGGQISAESTAEHTTFHVVLPVSPAEDASQS